MGIIKENLATIVLVFLIIIILLVLGVFIYKMTVNNKNENANLIIKEVVENIPNNSVDEHSKVQEQVKSEVNTQTDDKTLVEIVNIFNNCSAKEELALQGYTISAIAVENRIIAFTSGYGLSFNIEFILNDNILSTQIINNEADPRITAIRLTLAVLLLDCVGQMKGYPEKALSGTLSADKKALNYTVENEGIEMKRLDSGEGIQVRVDINSKFSFLNI